jgi:hypothetical protein
MPAFARTIGIHYSGAETAASSLPALRVYLAEGDASPAEARPSRPPQKHWTRRAIAEWLVDQLAEAPPTLVGINHGFSFPLRYFEAYGLALDWPGFLDDFQLHWPTGENIYVDFVLDGTCSDGAARMGDPSWLRLTEERAGSGLSVFRFAGLGALGKPSHAGIPWLRFIRARLGARVHFWPFDGWNVPDGRSVIAEAYPAKRPRGFAKGSSIGQRYDAWSIAANLARANHDGVLADWLNPTLTEKEREQARIEGWILGVR